VEFDLSRRLPKVTNESERSVAPAETVERALEALRRIGIQPRPEVWERDGFIWVATLGGDWTGSLPAIAKGMRVAGKGPSRDQCLASCYMELVERATLYRNVEAGVSEHDCLDMRDGRIYRLAGARGMGNTIGVAAGNNLEEAVLHALHELIETRLGMSCLWKPHKVVDFDLLGLELPGWVRDNYVAIKAPSDVREFCHVIVVRYPSDGRYDLETADTIIKAGRRIFQSSRSRPLNHHTPHSGGAAGLNPASCVMRGIGEVLQGDREVPDGDARKVLAPAVSLTDADDLRNWETDSVTGDIRLILDRLGEEVFVGFIDLTDPRMGVPVVKLVSDWSPSRSLVSPETIGLFFERPGGVAP